MAGNHPLLRISQANLLENGRPLFSSRVNALKVLKDRGIVYLNKKGNYVLTDDGCSFFEYYIKLETPFSLD